MASGTLSRTTGFGTGYRIAAETSNSARYFRGGIAEIIVYDHALTAEEQSILEDYLSQKYGISLPATPTPTETPTPSATSTPTPSDTPTPSETPVATDTPQVTDTPSLAPSETYTPEPTLTPSETPTPTETQSGGLIDPNYGLAWAGKLNSEVASVVFRLPSFSADLLPLAARLLDGEEEVTRTIQYSYDGLHRLVSAEYDDGNFFNYTYDSVGNRLSETTAFTNTIYTYDAASRLTSVNGVQYSWDANGNLLDDGVNTYTYDHANRLMGVTDGTDTYSFAYNGLGDRLQQTVGGVTTNYTLDLNAGLTQVLADGTNTFLYGLGRVAQYSQPLLQDTWAYHLPDALGSVRQLVDAAGAISAAQSFEPYGEALAAFGSQQTAYGFAGEWTDATGLQYLRARHYNPSVGAFFQMDPFEGYNTDPRSLHPYQYGYNNPILYTDPSGENPISQCLGLFATLALVDSPVIPAGDIAGILACGFILVSSGILAAQAAPEVAEAARDVAECTSWEWIATRPITPSNLSPEPNRQPQPFPFPIPNTRQFPEPNDRTRNYSVRLQAQGGGIQESEAITTPYPVTVAEGLEHLENLKKKIYEISRRELQIRLEAFARAKRFIQSGPPLGIGPTTRSYLVEGDPHRRVDVEVLRGVNFRR